MSDLFPRPCKGAKVAFSSNSAILFDAAAFSTVPFDRCFLCWPFVLVLDEKKVMSWEEGLAEGFHIGKTAKSTGRNRYAQFRKAFQAATIEDSKPLDQRLNWNHQGPALLPSPLKQVASTKKGEKRTAKKRPRDLNGQYDGEPTQLGTKKSARRSSSSSAPESRSRKPSRRNNSSNSGRQAQVNAPTRPQTQGASVRRQIPFNQTGSSYTQRAAPPVPQQHPAIRHQGNKTIVEQPAPMAQHGIPVHHHAGHPYYHHAGVPYPGMVPHYQHQAAGAMNPAFAAHHPAANPVEPSEDAELFCRIVRKEKDSAETVVGFVKLASQKKSTFADARKAIMNELVPDSLDADWSFKFLVPVLGPVSPKQETTLDPILPYLQQTSSSEICDGSLQRPAIVHLTKAVTKDH